MSDRTAEITQHIGWLKIYAETINEATWHDMKVRLLRQVAEVSVASAHLLAENERLRAALKPFARAADEINGDITDSRPLWYEDPEPSGRWWSADAERRARAAGFAEGQMACAVIVDEYKGRIDSTVLYEIQRKIDALSLTEAPREDGREKETLEDIRRAVENFYSQRDPFRLPGDALLFIRNKICALARKEETK